MVNNQGVIYTIEGLIAGILMITTAYLILSTTSVYTPGDTHISDLQMEQLGNDVLAVMDTPGIDQEASLLKSYIEADDGLAFRDTFRTLATTKASFEQWNWNDNIKLNASVYYRSIIPGPEYIDYYSFSGLDNLTGSEHIVKVTRRVLITDSSNISLKYGTDNRNQSVLLEVLMWRN